MAAGRLVIGDGAQDAASPLSDVPRDATPWERVGHPEDFSRLQAALLPCLAGTASDWSCEHRIRRADGAWHWVLNAGRVVGGDGRGPPARMAGVLFDLTDRHRLEESLRRDAQMLANVKESMVCTDLNGIVTYWNAGAFVLYGWTAAEMVGRPFWERMPTEAMRAHARFRMKTATVAGEFRHEREDFRKDGTRIFVDSRVFSIRDAAGRVVGVLGMGHDITARRQAELDRIQLERQLLHSQKMETIGTLAAGVAHEFNNILATIIGNTEMALLLHPEDQSHRECHDAVLQSSWRARDLVQRILALSRRSEPERRPVQLARIVAEASSLIRATLPSTVELVTECSAGAPDALADLNELHQVLLNLAANAAYAMREKGGRLTLRTFFAEFADSHPCALTTLPAGAYVALEVADTGRGIEARHLPKIFDPFYTTKPVGEGSGLGLAIVQNIVARHGGAIEVASTPGAGAVFTLYFPVATGGIPARVRTDAAPRPLGLARGQGERVAVIDDEEPIAIVIEAALRQLNYAPRRFSSADEFYAEFVAGRFAADLVVTDQTMPRLTGLQLARKLRAEGHAIPLVIMSGYNPQSAPESAVEGGRVAHLEKPFDLNQLAATVQYLLRPTGPR